MPKRELHKKVITLLLPYKKYIVAMSMLMLAITVGNVFIPLLQQKIVDKGLVLKDVNTLACLVAIVILIALVANIATLIQAYLRIDLNAKFLKDKQIEILNHAMRLKIDYIKNDGLVQIIKDAEYSLNNVSQITGNQMSDTLTQIFKFVGVFIGLMVINWKLTMFLLLLIPIRLIITNKLSKHVEKYQMDTLVSQKGIHGWEDDIYHSATEVKLWNLYDKKSNEYEALLKERNVAVKKMGLFSILSTLLGDGIQTIFFNLLYVLGGLLIWRDSLTLGGMLAFISYSNYLMEPIGFISDLKIVLSEVGPALNMYEKFLSLSEEDIVEQKGKRICCNHSIKPTLKCRNLTFAFKDRTILNNVNMDMFPGDRIAIIGENGSGKSTLINLLLRFYKIQKGSILLNDKDIGDYDLQSYRTMFSVIMQNPYLFRGTIKDNLTLFGKNIVSEELMQSGLLDFVDELPDKLNTNIGNNASHLSGGEKQKVALVRAMAAQSRILVLDEPTSAYDKKSEEAFLELLKKSRKEIIIMITHEPKLLKFANKIFKIENGELVQYKGYENYISAYKRDIGGKINEYCVQGN